MYAIIQQGIRQYKVEKGSIIYIDLLNNTNNNTIQFSDVLLYQNENSSYIGNPILKNILVEGKLLDTVKANKIHGFKYKRRKKVRRRWGHRQKYHKVEITSIADTA